MQRLRRWRWLVWLQSLLLLGWSFCPPWTVWGESVFWTGGTWHIHGNPQTWEGTWSYDDFVPDADGDGLPDEFDPYPAEAHNRSCLFPGGVWAIDGQERYFESAWFDAFDGTLADVDGDGLPDLLDPHPQTQHNLSAWFAGGTWVVDGVRCFWEGMWLPCAYESSSLPDTDADGLPDLLDAHPQDAENHSFWFNGGLFTRNDLTLALRAGHYAGSSADANADGLPDSLEDLFLHPSNYGTLQHWPGGTFLINGEWNTYGPVGYFAPEVADRDGDGIPDELDAAADDAWNGSYFEWQGGQFRVHGILCDFAPGWYGGDSQDADGDGLPNGADPLPSDPDNNSAWWAGGTFLVDGAYQEFPGQWHQANAGDADQDGLPDDLDPYPADAQNPTPEPSFTWAGGTFIIDGAERGFAPGSYAGGWADTDSDLIPDCLDPYPAETANNSEWWSGGSLVVNGVEQTFAAGWHRANAGDADQDGIPEDLDPYPGDPQNPTPAPPQTFYWQGGAFRIHGLEQVFEAGLRDGVWADADGDLLPDSLDPCPGDAANNSAWWSGGTWLVHGQETAFDARWQRADCPDGDGDGLPDDLDPLPGDPWNGSGWYWPEEPQLCLRINDQDHAFTRQLYLTPWADADADGIPDVADPLPQDAYNGNDSDADGLYDSVEVLYPGVLNPQYAQDVLQERVDGVSYLRAYEYNWRARSAGRPDLMLALDAPIPAERDSDQDTMSDRFEARHGLNPFDENDAVDSFTPDYALNAEKAAWARSPWEPVTPEEYATVTGQDWSDFATHHIDSLSYAENDWDGDGVSNRDEVLIFRTALRQAASRPTEAALLEAMLAGRVSQTTLLNHQFLLPVQDSCGCSASGCPIQGCYCSNGSCVPVEAAPLPTTPLACGCGYTLMTPSQCGCGSSQSCSPSTPCTPLVLVDEALPTPACTCPNYTPSIGNACGCSRQCFGEMNDPACRHYTMDCACSFAGLCTSKPPVYDAEGVEITPGVPCQCAYNCDAGAPARYGCTCGCSSCPSSTDPATYAQGCPNPTPAPGPNQIKIGNLPCDPILPFDIEGHKRGTINSPGTKVSKGAGEYGQETVMMENADFEDNATLPDYATARVDADADDDFVKVVLYWPKEVRIHGAKLELKHVGMEVDLNKTSEGEKYKQSGPSRLSFYKPDGAKLTNEDLKVENLGGPATSYLSEIINTGKLVLFVEGMENFGNLGLTKSKMRLLGGAMLNFELTENEKIHCVRLLIYRGGFIVFRQPKNEPGNEGDFEFWDGKGRVNNENNGYQKEFDVDITDWGRCLGSWKAKSGKKGGNKDYRVGGGKGHVPPGWWWAVESPLAPIERQVSKASGYIKNYNQSNEKWNQSGFCRWLQDDSSWDRRYAVDFIYDNSILADKKIGRPDFMEYKFRLYPIPPTEVYSRSGILIHPDGNRDGTLGCIGLQTWGGVKSVGNILRHYHGLKLKVQNN